MQIYNLVRAVTEPYPGTFTYLPEGEKLFIWWALPEKSGISKAPVGALEFEEENVYVRASDGRLRLLDIEAGKKRMKAHKIHEYFKKQEGVVLK
jgi:methionyl-tRNA formyltransferase